MDAASALQRDSDGRRLHLAGPDEARRARLEARGLAIPRRGAELVEIIRSTWLALPSRKRIALE
eukprot:915410-Alexandrium_andersonii.AAC.1